MSGSILFLTGEDFNVQKGMNGGLLCHGIPDFSLILFYSTYCQHCQTIIPVFKRLPSAINGCQFGMINVSSNKSVVEMSQSTITPIKYVPYIVFYVNGKPFMIYKGPYTEGDIRNFVVEVANNIQQKQQFSKEKVHNTGEGIPAYCIGKPLVGNDAVCYLTFNGAYTGKPGTNQNQGTGRGIGAMMSEQKMM
jgi:thiol-disulfide isomerase/thioredoxin